MPINLIPLKDVATSLGIVPNTLRRLAYQGKIAHSKIGAKFYFTPEQAADIVKIHTPGAPTSDVTHA